MKIVKNKNRSSDVYNRFKIFVRNNPIYYNDLIQCNYCLLNIKIITEIHNTNYQFVLFITAAL